jgi:hypothetical protein
MSDRQSELESRPLLQRGEARELCRLYGVGNRTFKEWIKTAPGLRRRLDGYRSRSLYITAAVLRQIKNAECRMQNSGNQS